MNKLKKQIVQVAYEAKEGHIASSFSILDILYVLYDEYLKSEDKFILSKGHASLGIYSILKEFGYITEDELFSFCQIDSKLGGHPNCNKVTGVEFSTGSLGHGFPMALGEAFAVKIKGTNENIVCLIGDGEANEGTIWESAMLASHHKLNNLTLIIDYNHSTDRAILIDDLVNKFRAFGWETLNLEDGHNHNDILNALNFSTKKPKCIIANTIKGKGVKMMENNPAWHHRAMTEEEYKIIMEELK